MSFTVVPVYSFKPQLSTESAILPRRFQDDELVPIMGDFATQIACRLNEIFRKDGSDQEHMVQSMGRDMGDKNDPTKSYAIGRNDVVTGAGDSVPAIRDGHLSVEHVEGGLGLYDITGEIAGLIKGNSHPFIWTIQYETLTNKHIEKVRQLIVEGYFVNLVILVPAGIKMDEVQLKCSDLFSLMESTDRLAVFATFVVTKA
nr:MAG TPA: protein of unknown function (DUF5439) [Caudoviricetes sp.]